MKLDIRMPELTGATNAEKISQLQNYMIQLARKLQWAFNTIETGQSETDSTAAAGAEKIVSTTGAQITPETFGALKSLIIKSADIVNAYYEQMNRRFEGDFVAQSAFGTYREQTAHDIEANSSFINQVFADLQKITSTVSQMQEKDLAASAYIKSGLLYYDDEGFPVYGLEIGQENSVDGEVVFDKFARFISGRLSFFDRNDVEVAYISDYKLFITNVHITGKLMLGPTHGYFEVDTSNGICIRWKEVSS